jgi:hypothetical protein
VKNKSPIARPEHGHEGTKRQSCRSFVNQGALAYQASTSVSHTDEDIADAGDEQQPVAEHEPRVHRRDERPRANLDTASFRGGTVHLLATLVVGLLLGPAVRAVPGLPSEVSIMAAHVVHPPPPMAEVPSAGITG